MKEYFDEINVMINRTVNLLPKKENPNYTTSAILASGCLVGLNQTTKIYKDDDKLTKAEYKKLVNKISKKIDNL